MRRLLVCVFSVRRQVIKGSIIYFYDTLSASGYLPTMHPLLPRILALLEPLCDIFVAADEMVATAYLPYTEPQTMKVEAVSEDLIEIAAKIKQKLRFDDFGITHRKGKFLSLFDVKPAFRCPLTRIE